MSKVIGILSIFDLEQVCEGWPSVAHPPAPLPVRQGGAQQDRGRGGGHQGGVPLASRARQVDTGSYGI